MTNSGDCFECKRSIGRGFTLIELLTVIAIVTVLAGILLPVFVQVRERGRQTACLSNTKQIGLAICAYTQDYDERLPSGTIGSLGQGWAGQAYPYVRSVNLYRCPDDGTSEAKGDPNLLISYAVNCNATGNTEAGFSAPAATVLSFEVNDSFADVTKAETTSPTGRGLPKDNCPAECGKPFGADYYATGNVGGVTPSLSTTLRPYHDPTSNYLAVDGHAKALRGESISPGFNALSPDAVQSPSAQTAAGTESLQIAPGVRAALTFSIQ